MIKKNEKVSIRVFNNLCVLLKIKIRKKESKRNFIVKKENICASLKYH